MNEKQTTNEYEAIRNEERAKQEARREQERKVSEMLNPTTKNAEIIRKLKGEK